MLAAARARASGRLAIVLPGLLAVLASVVRIVLVAQVPDTPLSFRMGLNGIVGLVAGWIAVRYDLDGHRARSYLRRFADPAAANRSGGGDA
ncbi:hypothetical protein ACFFWC_14225 [Plantactinospora siamensis]|uniref:Uncharacterized protein n=1 Tax=Plantactinospora siamensis TaxID=555372 RepID=A0ABV6P1H1_9ACTN